MTDASNDPWLQKLQMALAAGEKLIPSVESFDAAARHIHSLLTDASVLYVRGSFNTSTFLAITALEEVAKLQVGSYRNGADNKKRREDPLFSHKDKHLLSAAPTIPMGARLPDAIGTQRLEALMKMAQAGDLVSLRERCLYFSFRDNNFEVPSHVITAQAAREIILFAIEAFDDGIVGSTNLSMELGKDLDKVFSEVAQ